MPAGGESDAGEVEILREFGAAEFEVQVDGGAVEGVGEVERAGCPLGNPGDPAAGELFDPKAAEHRGDDAIDEGDAALDGEDGSGRRGRLNVECFCRLGDGYAVSSGTFIKYLRK
jgi:hypothetical protein